ncbi:MAG TPA: carboxypeptidase-like regulatory domain-containing protein, partial [Asanoa sp.]|nr:carboxypeptidase-like regulatory domain-containing protein [Asanoa sp.]
MALPTIRRASAAVAAVVLTGGLAVWATPAQAAGTGVVSGRVTTTAGGPAAGIVVQISDFDTWEFVDLAFTADDGTYSVGGIETDTYTVTFSGENAPTQYFDGKTDISEADPVRVTNGQTTTVNDQLLPAGVISGRLVQSTGEPLVGSWVSLSSDTGYSSYASTDENGDYRSPVPVGTYRVSFQPMEDSYQEQYVPGQISSDNAGAFPVTAGGQTRVDDTVLGVGSLSGRLTNDDGTPVREASVYVSPFQANGSGANAETNGNGEFSVPKLLVGRYMAEFYVGERHQFFDGAVEWNDADPVTVTAGNTTRVTESMLPTGSIRVRALDAL